MQLPVIRRSAVAEVVEQKKELLPLSLGNTKLGQAIWHFSLPAISTCPGRTDDCEAVCYATQGNYNYDNVQSRLRYNEVLRRDPGFELLVSNFIRSQLIRVVRIHVAGDFDTIEYVDKWVRIAMRNPDTIFFAYTRSWRVPNLRKRLLVLAKLPNVQLWWSCDRQTKAPRKHATVRRAYMALSDEDIPNYAVDLVFRASRSTKQVTQGQTLVCPAERQSWARGRSKKSSTLRKPPRKVTCSQCQLCFNRTGWLDDMNSRLRQLDQLVSEGGDVHEG